MNGGRGRASPLKVSCFRVQVLGFEDEENGRAEARPSKTSYASSEEGGGGRGIPYIVPPFEEILRDYRVANRRMPRNRRAFLPYFNFGGMDVGFGGFADTARRFGLVRVDGGDTAASA